MVIGEQHRYVFVSCTRCATHTMTRLLVESYGGLHLTWIREGRTSGGADPFHIPGRDIPEQFRGFFTFIVSRDPYDRAVSLWRYLRARAVEAFWPCMGDGTFLSFAGALADRRYDALEAKWREHVLNQAEWHEGFSPARVLRIETLQRDVQALPLPDIGGVRLHVRNRPEDYDGAPRPPLWTQALYEVIRPWAKPDCDSYGYPVRG